MNHPNVVQVFTFLRHGTEGYIVMELVNGKNLLQIRRDNGGPLPVPTAISYILNILPAFGYLDSRGLIYMDMKLENVMVVDDGQGNTVEKLIDLGAVRRVDDKGGDLFATAGYSAPEVSANPASPTPVSDLYSVARALALLVCDFAYQDGPYEFVLPTPDTTAIFAEHESLYRFLTRATAEAPDARFQTADEMAQQLLGVLREEIAGTTAAAELGAYQSTLFGHCVSAVRHHLPGRRSLLRDLRPAPGSARLADPGTGDARPRCTWRHVRSITHCIGPLEGADGPLLEPHARSMAPSTAGLLVLCSDGFWNYTADTDAVAALVGSAPADADAETVARLLVQFALDSGGMDNVTVAVARLASMSNGVT